ncbi:MAG TPA: SAF domain-containing protein [Acidimicrobiales bacterium]|nr:SAF domain-containing protein [Acidimicrobiales bacterium]
MHRIRWWFARYPLLSWLPPALAAFAVAWLTSATIDGATADVRRLGPMVQVPVAARSIEPGRVLEDADVAWRRLPRGALPRGEPAREPVGGTALVPLAEGEVLLRPKLAPDGLVGPAALVPPGSSGVAVPVPEGERPPLRAGDRVDLLAAGDEGGAAAVAVGALVVDVAEEVVTVAVDAEDAPAVAYAVARGVVTIALSPWAGSG